MPTYPIQATCDLKTGGPWSDREARLKKECGENGELRYPENEWGVSDRQAYDGARAAENAARRQRYEWESQRRCYRGAFPEPAITINTTRRWSGNQDKGGEITKEQEERGEYRRGKLTGEETEK